MHTVLNTSFKPDDFNPSQHDQILVGMGCFWGAERLFWKLDPSIIHTTSVGYSGGIDNPVPTYETVCSGRTNQTEVVQIVYKKDFDMQRPANLNKILKAFWENHDPTQGNRQGNDVGTQYRSAIYCQDEKQLEHALNSKKLFQEQINSKNLKAEITTEICQMGLYHLGEDYHQQYLAKNPNGYCGLRGTGLSCPLP